MTVPTSAGADYNAIHLTWVAVTAAADSGGDPIIYYYVDWFYRPCYEDDNADCDSEPLAMGFWMGISTQST